MSMYVEVRWHGRGGQGTVTGAKALAKVVQKMGKNVVAFPEYGPERRGAPLKAFNRFSDGIIRIHTPVLKPNIVIVVDVTLLENPDIKQGIYSDTIFIVNSEKSALTIKQKLGVPSSNRVFTVPANKISKEIFNREIPNSAVMGAFVRACPEIMDIDRMLKETNYIFEEFLGKDLVEKNLEAIKRGYEEGESA